MNPLDKEATIVESLRKKEITLKEAATLTESNVQTFSSGKDVYIQSGIHAGKFGKYLKEVNGGYYEVDCGAAGVVQTPAIFVIDSEQAKA